VGGCKGGGEKEEGVGGMGKGGLRIGGGGRQRGGKGVEGRAGMERGLGRRKS